MGKAEAGSVKAVGNAIKARGLLKTKFYCQVCDKQCRDANGFKCHTESEAHLRKMQIVAANAQHYLDQYSQQFEQGYLDILSRRHLTKRINANVVYNEYIQDRHHIHLNATIWSTLTEFVRYLGEEGKCRIDETEQGWYIQWLDRDNPKALAQRKDQNKKRQQDADDEERRRRSLNREIAAAQAAAGDSASSATAPSDPSASYEAGEQVVTLKVVGRKRAREQASQNGLAEAFESDEDHDGGSAIAGTSAASSTRPQHAAPSQESQGGADSAKFARIEGSQSRSAVPPREDHPGHSHRERRCVATLDGTWLAQDLVVKVVSSKPGHGAYKKRKGRVRRVVEAERGRFSAELQMLDDDRDRPIIKESHLETVVPNLGNTVAIVSHDPGFDGRGRLAKLLDLDLKRFSARVRVLYGSRAGKEMSLPYENICKFILPASASQ